VANVEATNSSRRELMEADNRDGKSNIGSSFRVLLDEIIERGVR
jgi:hypothetical protein